MPGFARLNAGVVRIGRHLAKRRNIMWRLQFDLSREQNSPDQPGKRVQNGRSATPLIVISRFELPLLGSNQDSPDPEPSPAGLFGGHHVRKWLPAKHRRPQARGAMPGLVRRNACKMLVESSARLSRTVVRRVPKTGASVLQVFLSSTRNSVHWRLDWSVEFPVL